MWHIDEHIAKVMFDDKADLEVKQRGLPVPMPDPLQHVNRYRWASVRAGLNDWLVAFADRWDLACRWLGRLGRAGGCDRPAVYT